MSSKLDSLFLVAALWLALSTAAPDFSCDNWGVVDGTSERRPFDATAQEHVKCKFQYKDFAEESRAVVNWYPDTQSFSDYRAVDMIPERHWEYQQNLDDNRKGIPTGLSNGVELLAERIQKWRPGENGPATMTQKIQKGECTVPQADGGAWHVQRFGPFVSTGNYDWWQMGSRDIFRMSEVLKDHPEGVYFSTTFSAPVTSSGEVLQYPPIHIHHIHVVPQPGVKKKMDVRRFGVMVAMEQHGDYECVPEEGGTNCLFEKPAGDDMKELRQVLDLEGELNDVRAPNSQPMTWWYQVAIRWHPKSIGYKHPLSQAFLIHKSGASNHSNQLMEVGIMEVPTDQLSIFWYSGTMWADGDLVRNKIHAHNAMFKGALWFHATPTELGLVRGSLKFPEQRRGPGFDNPVGGSHGVIHLKDIGVTTFGELNSYFEQNLETAQKAYRSQCTSFLRRGNGKDPNPSCEFQEPFKVCEAEGRHAEVFDEVTGRSYDYDRRARACCKPWKFKRGESFTTVGFFQGLQSPLGPWTSTVPRVSSEHLHWVFSYKASGALGASGHSSYSVNNYGRVFGMPVQKEEGLEILEAFYPEDAKQFQRLHRWPDGLYDLPLPDDASFMELPHDDARHFQVIHRGQFGKVLSTARDSRLLPCGMLLGVLTAFLGSVFRLQRSLRETTRCTALNFMCPPPCCPLTRASLVQKNT